MPNIGPMEIVGLLLIALLFGGGGFLVGLLAPRQPRPWIGCLLGLTVPWSLGVMAFLFLPRPAAPMTRGRSSKVGILAVVLGTVADLSVAVGVARAKHYYDGAFGGWQVGFRTAGIGVAVAAVGVGVALLLWIAAWWIPWGELPHGVLPRAVLRAATVLLVGAGALIGAGAGYAYAHDGGGSLAAGVIVGVASAFGSWTLGALFALLIEIADSLRTIASGSR